MSILRQYIYISIFGLILVASFIAIIKLIQINKTSSPLSTPTINHPLEAQIITWGQTEQLMSECQIKSVFQKHDRTVTLRSYENIIYQTTQTKIDDIFKLAKKYQGPCDIIQMITE